MTLIYGTNGSGKSSYFRILNEVSGGNQPTPITPNIYNDINEVIDEPDRIYQGWYSCFLWDWNGEIRGIEPFTFISVFDSRYSEKYLNKRTPGHNDCLSVWITVVWVCSNCYWSGKSIESEVEN